MVMSVSYQLLHLVWCMWTNMLVMPIRQSSVSYGPILLILQWTTSNTNSFVGRDWTAPSSIKASGSERGLPCEVCGKVFAMPSLLKRHTLIHTGAQPFKCSHCHKGFNQKANLKVHIRNVHNLEDPSL